MRRFEVVQVSMLMLKLLEFGAMTYLSDLLLSGAGCKTYCYGPKTYFFQFYFINICTVGNHASAIAEKEKVHVTRHKVLFNLEKKTNHEFRKY